MKIAVIGGGSTYTPELVSGLSRERGRIDVSDLVLHDIDPERREVVGGLAQRMLERQGYEGKLEITDDLDRAADRFLPHRLGLDRPGSLFTRARAGSGGPGTAGQGRGNDGRSGDEVGATYPSSRLLPLPAVWKVTVRMLPDWLNEPQLIEPSFLHALLFSANPPAGVNVPESL